MRKTIRKKENKNRFLSLKELGGSHRLWLIASFLWMLAVAILIASQMHEIFDILLIVPFGFIPIIYLYCIGKLSLWTYKGFKNSVNRGTWHRLGSFVTILFLPAIPLIISFFSLDTYIMKDVFLGASLALTFFLAIHFLIRVVFWVLEGFSNKNAEKCKDNDCS